MRYWHGQLLAVTLLFCAGCGGTRSAPGDPLDVYEHLDYQLFQLQTAIEREDLLLASAPIGDTFTLDNDISLRWRDVNWEGSGPGAFRGFLDDVFELHANIRCELRLVDLVQDGDLATATVDVSFRSQRTDAIPPGQFLIDEEDYFLFQRSGAAWRIIRWQETPPPATPLP